MNDYILAPGGACGECRDAFSPAKGASLAGRSAIPAVPIPPASPAAAPHPGPECVACSEESATFTGTASLMRVLGVLIAALATAFALALADAAPAQAQSIRSSCKIYAENRVDPIAFTQHLHRQFGNTSTTNDSNGESLYQKKATSCDASWWTNAGWFPVERYESVPNAIIYYRAPGDQTQITNLARGMEFIAKIDSTNNMDELSYACGSSPGDTSPAQATPPYDCTQNWSTQLRFPRCWDGVGTEHTDFRYGPNRTSCPTTHPYTLPEINVLVRHPNTDGVVPNPLEVSMGVDEWHDYTHFHGDYIFAAQDEFNKAVDLDGDGKTEQRDADGDGKFEPWQENATHTGDAEGALHNLCLKNAPDELEFNNARCRAGGLLSSHIKALKSYYG